MEIDLPPAAHEKLASLAADAGHDRVEGYVAEYLCALAEHPRLAELTPRSEEQLRASAAMCDRSMAEIDAGGGQDASDALLELGRQFDFDPEP